MAIKNCEDKSFFGLTVKAVVVNEENQVLLVKRSQKEHSGKGKFDLPGGKLDIGENIKAGLEREIKEEVGIEVELGPILYAFDFGEKYNDQYEIGDKTLLVGGKGLRYLAYYCGGDIKLSCEHDGWEWADIDEALKKFGEDDFEKDKKVAIKRAQEYLEMKKSLDGWRRCLADFENYKKRQIEERKDLAKYANLNLILEILPVVDNFQASTGHIPVDQKDSPWVVGIMHIQKQLEKILEDNNLQEIVVRPGDTFNPEVMEAIGNNESQKNKEDKNIVAKVLTRGYQIGDRVARAARVMVE